MMKWQQTLEDAVKYKNTIILCGNVRDKYLYLEPHTDNQYDLLDLKTYLIRYVGRQVNTLCFYDPICKKTDYSPNASSPASTTADELDDPDGLGALTEPESSDDWGRSSPVERDLERIRDEATSGQNACWVVQYADKMTPEKPSGGEERKLVLQVEKLIENLPPGNKLFLIYLFQEQIPRELYVNHPKTKVIELQPPDRQELRTLFTAYYRLSEDDTERAVNISDGLKCLDIEQVVNSIEHGFDIQQFEERVRTYKFGKATNYWDEVSLQKLDGAKDFFIEQEGVKGQDQAIKKVINIVMRAKADIHRKTGGNPRSPRGVLFFAGPTGVGKTLTAKTLAKFLFGSEDALQRFDMSEYKDDFQVTRLYGAPPGYVGYESGGTLTNAVKARPFTVLLFDEMEKAHPRVFDIFLQILSDGRLTDSKGEVVFFSESIILFTSNLGTRTSNKRDEPCEESAVFERLKQAGDNEALNNHFVDSVKKFFQSEISRPELLNRIGSDNIVSFNLINDEETIKGMLKNRLQQIEQIFNESYSHATPKLAVEMDIHAIVESFYHRYRDRVKESGGREVENLINEKFRDELALQVLKAEFDRRSSAVIRVVLDADVAGEEMLRFELV